MKRLTLAFPFDHMSGKLGVKQDLRYPESDNKAFEAPEGKTSYARNYKPTMVTAHVARTGLQYFAIKTKSAFKNTAAARLLCALVGAVAAIYGWVIKQATILSKLQQQYDIAVNGGVNSQGQAVGGDYEGTFHKWLTNQIRTLLKAKVESIVIVGPTASVTIGNNPFCLNSDAIAISNTILVKFWKILCPDGITFTIDGATMIALNMRSFGDVIAYSRLNVLGLSQSEVSGVNYYTLNGHYILDSRGNYLSDNTIPTNGEAMVTTEDEP